MYLPIYEEDEYLIIVAVNELAGNAAVDVELCMSRKIVFDTLSYFKNGDFKTA